MGQLLTVQFQVPLTCSRNPGNVRVSGNLPKEMPHCPRNSLSPELTGTPCHRNSKDELQGGKTEPFCAVSCAVQGVSWPFLLRRFGRRFVYTQEDCHERYKGEPAEDADAEATPIN